MVTGKVDLGGGKAVQRRVIFRARGEDGSLSISRTHVGPAPTRRILNMASSDIPETVSVSSSPCIWLILSLHFALLASTGRKP